MGERLSSPTFAGREVELDRLWTTFDALDATGARTLLVGGEAGIGKTRLIDEHCARARAAGALVAAGVCTPAEGGGLPYGPVVGVVRDLSRQLDDATAAAVLEPVRRELGLVELSGTATTDPATTGSAQAPAEPLAPAPAPAEPLAPAQAPAVVVELVKTRLFEALLTCLTALAERSRLVVVFEDLHWADSGTVEVVEFLARNLGEQPVLLIGTYRSDEPDQARPHPGSGTAPGQRPQPSPLRRMLAELGRHRAVEHLELTGLDRDATAALMSGILGREPEWTLVDAVHGRCGGNPFFAEELTASRDATSLPTTLRHVIMLRVERLSPAAHDVVAIAATAGTSIDHRLLATVMATPVTGVSPPGQQEQQAAVAEAVTFGILVVDDRLRYGFRHALQREAIYDSLLPTERTDLHRRLAAALTAHPELAATGPGHAAVELANHWWEANTWSEALQTSITAGDTMAALLAMPEAHAQYERALAAGDSVPPDAAPSVDDHLRLLERAAEAAYFVGDVRRACELTRAALDRIDPQLEPQRAALLQTRLARYVFTLGHLHAAFEAFEAAAALLPQDPPAAELAYVLAQEARCLLLLSRFREAEARCHAALAAARANGARAEEGHALDTLGILRGLMGKPDEGITLVREALAIAEDLVIPDNLNLGYTHLSLLLLLGGRLESAAAVSLDGVALGEALGGIRLNGAAVNSAEALIALGRLSEAEALLADLDELVGNCAASPPLLSMVIALRRGQGELAAEWLATVDRMTAHLSDVEFRARFHRLAAELALDEGRPGEASDEVENAISLAAGTDEPLVVEICALGVRALADGVEEARARGRGSDLDKAHLLAAAFVQEAERGVTPVLADGVPLPGPAAFLAVCRAEQSRLDRSDPELWAAAVAEWDELTQPYEAAYCRWREAEARLQARSGRGRAIECVEQAWRDCVRIGAAGLGARIERLAQRARITLPAGEAVDGDEGVTAAEAEGVLEGDKLRRRVAEDLQLTPREVEVLAQLVRGRTDRQIADDLYISRKTASVHVSNILRKLDAANRFDAAEIGQRAGL